MFRSYNARDKYEAIAKLNFGTLNFLDLMLTSYLVFLTGCDA